MAITTCPTATIDAPIDRVWSLLIDPREWSRWSGARLASASPDGDLHAGQHLRFSADALGLHWSVRTTVFAVAPDEHTLDIEVATPFGIVNHEHVTVAPVAPDTTFVSFG